MLVNSFVYRCYECDKDTVVTQPDILHCKNCLGRLKYIGQQYIEMKALKQIFQRQREQG